MVQRDTEPDYWKIGSLLERLLMPWTDRGMVGIPRKVKVPEPGPDNRQREEV